MSLTSDIQKLETTMKVLSDIFSQSVDIHSYTRNIGAHYRVFAAQEDNYRLLLDEWYSEDSVEAIIKEIMDICPAAKRANVMRVLATIQATTTNDPETGANLQVLLRRAWAMKDVYANGTELLIDNLSHNIEAGGGCVAGIAARLIQPYTAFLLAALRRLESPEQPLVRNSEEEQMALALSMSLSVNQRMPKVAEDLSEEEQLAMIASMEEPRRQAARDEDLEIALALSIAEVRRTMVVTYASTPAPLDPEEEQLKEALALSKHYF